jgi:hypothetical protein
VRAATTARATTAEDRKLQRHTAVAAVVQPGRGADELLSDLADVPDRRVRIGPQVGHDLEKGRRYIDCGDGTDTLLFDRGDFVLARSRRFSSFHRKA